MDDRDVSRFWSENAEAWTVLTRMGCDVLRDHVVMPAFLAMLPRVSGLHGLDIGCGEGNNTRLVAARGARMLGIDIVPTFIRDAREIEESESTGIHYQVASASRLPFASETLDFAIATMSLMDTPDQPRALAEAFRVLVPGGFLQFSICHPCFATPRWQWLYNDAGDRDAIVCGDYFREFNGELEQWIFSATPPALKNRFAEFRIPRFTRTLSGWLNLLLQTGFVLECFDEPCADEETISRYPLVADSRIIAYALIVRCRKPRSSGKEAA